MRTRFSDRAAASSAWADARFVVSLVGVSLMQFLRHNRRVPLAEWRRWERLASPRLAAAAAAPL